MKKDSLTHENKLSLVFYTLAIMVVITAFIFRITEAYSSAGDPGETTEYFQEGQKYEKAEDYENAIVSYRTDIKVNPDNAASYNALAWLFIDKLDRNYGEAIELAKIAVSLTEDKDHPSRNYWLANYLDTLGWAYYKNGEYEKAVISLERAVNLVPNEEYELHLHEARKARESNK